MNYIINSKNLFKRFGGIKAVNNFSFSVKKTSITALIGPNGAGKTTVFNLITGFLDLDAGSIIYKNFNITRLPPYKIAIKGIARTFQDLRLITRISVLDNVLLSKKGQLGEKLFYVLLNPFKLKKEKIENKERAISYLKMVDLEDFKDELAEDISYGQQKLLTLACCMASEADLLLLDEPVSGIHPHMIEKILSIMKALSEQGKTIMFIEHNIDAVLKIADYVIVMDEGRKIDEGEPEIIMGNPKIVEAYLD